LLLQALAFLQRLVLGRLPTTGHVWLRFCCPSCQNQNERLCLQQQLQINHTGAEQEMFSSCSSQGRQRQLGKQIPVHTNIEMPFRKKMVLTFKPWALM
jgi:hypothetical protein